MKKMNFDTKSNESGPSNPLVGSTAGPMLSTLEGGWDSTNEKPSAAANDAAGARVDIEGIVRNYRVIRTISETSASIVYKAEDARTKRHVAIKVIYNRGLPDFERINRARVEIERLRHLSHPGIAALFDAGLTPEGHCYLVSEFIKGVSLNEYLAIHKLTLEDRFAVFMRICEAVHYAHQKCLLHRDLRPSNIVIDGKCNPKLVGLGVASVTDVDVGPAKEGSGRRELREFLVYKSPEQVACRIYDTDVRSDVYSLGVILYELLTDRLPYSCNSESGKEIVQAVRSEMPAKPGSVKANLRGDLEAIVLKTLEKQPSDRYQNVLALMQDLENYLGKRPVGARRAGAMYEFRKLATRYKSRSISVVILFLAMLAFGLHIHATTRDAGRARVAEIEQRMMNEAARQKVANDILVEQMNAAKALAQAETRERERIESRLSGFNAELQAVQSDRDAYAHRAELAEARAGSLEAVSKFWRGVVTPSGDLAEDAVVERLLEQAAARISKSLSDQPIAAAAAFSDIGQALLRLNRAARAAEMHGEALRLRSDALGSEDEQTIESIHQLAAAFFAAGDAASAEPVCRELVLVTTRVFGERDPRTLTAVNNLAMTLHARQQLTEAEQLLRTALEARRELFGPSDRRTASTWQNLGIVLFDAGRPADALGAFKEALTVFEGRLPANHALILDTQSRIGGCLVEMGQFENAEPILIGAHKALKTMLGDAHPETSAALERVVNCYQNWGKPDSAQLYASDYGQPNAEASVASE